MSDDFWRIARKYTPPYIKIKWKRKRGGVLVLAPAYACIENEEMLVPKPETIEALAYYLHECSHFWLRHFSPSEARSKKMRDLYTGGETGETSTQEYQAEQWTIATMRREGLSVPAHIMDDMSSYVASYLEIEEGKPPRHIRRFVNRSKKKARGRKGK